VSCSPLTFARDLDHLARLGFAPERVETFDMMPQSDEVESLAIVRPAPRPTLTIAAATEELVAIVVPPHTSPREVERAASNALGSPDVVAVAAIPPDASGLALYARSEASAARARASLELTCTAVVRGIAREKGAIARPARASRDARTRYRRRGTAGGHAVLLLTILGGGDLEAASTHLAWIGHPPLGDERRCDPRTRQHLFERHGLDRSFVHVGGVRVGDELTATCPLAADLEAVLAGLRAATRPTSPRRTSEPARDDP
jgi:23S rRNA (uracil1939-C5)-methyltransferase